MGKPDAPKRAEIRNPPIAGWRTVPAPPPVSTPEPVQLLPAVDAVDNEDTAVDEEPVAPVDCVTTDPLGLVEDLKPSVPGQPATLPEVPKAKRR